MHVYAFAIHFMVHCGSAFEPGASGLPFTAPPSVCIPDVIGAIQKPKNKKVEQIQQRLYLECSQLSFAELWHVLS